MFNQALMIEGLTRTSIALSALLLAGCVSESTPTESSSSSSVAPASSSVASSVAPISSSSESNSSSIPMPVSSSAMPSSSSAPAAIDWPLVVAINAGGDATTMDGIEFIADKYAGGGSLNNTVDSVVGGTVYQSERYGALKYEIPVTANGSYTVKLHFAEIYQTAADARSFSVAIEGNPVITGLDLFAEVGHDVGYTETFENIAVSDGGVSIELIAGTENPTIAGFEIYSGDGELDTSVVYEPAKDFSKFSAYQGRYEEAATINARHATGHVGDFFFTHWQDRGTTTMDLETNGEFQVNWTSDTGNYVGGPGWHYGDENRVIGTRIDSDSGASFFTIYGWGYNKDQNRNDPYHLVEYYILLRGTYNVLGNPGATRGITFTSNGVEYQTVRSDRNGQASINSTSTFKQYWSIPSQQAGIGETREIIFADHVNAWAENGWPMPDMNNIDASDDPTYQVLAAEVFGINSNGSASGRVWDATP